MLNRILIYLFLLVKSSILFSISPIKTIKLASVEKINSDFAIIVDSIIDFEKKCKYYTDSLFFHVTITEYSEKSDSLYINIESGKDKKIVINLEPIAFFERKRHRFFVYDAIPTILFPSIGDFVSMSYKTRHPYEEPDEKGNVFIFFDDSFSTWEYFFCDNKFTLLRSFSWCE